MLQPSRSPLKASTRMRNRDRGRILFADMPDIDFFNIQAFLTLYASMHSSILLPRELYHCALWPICCNLLQSVVEGPHTRLY
jgi:hypothetical protein